MGPSISTRKRNPRRLNQRLKRLVIYRGWKDENRMERRRCHNMSLGTPMPFYVAGTLGTRVMVHILPK